MKPSYLLSSEQSWSPCDSTGQWRCGLRSPDKEICPARALPGPGASPGRRPGAPAPLRLPRPRPRRRRAPSAPASPGLGSAPRARTDPPGPHPSGVCPGSGRGWPREGGGKQTKKNYPKRKKNKRERGQKYFQMFGGCRSQALPQHMIHGGPSGWCLHLIPC